MYRKDLPNCGRIACALIAVTMLAVLSGCNSVGNAVGNVVARTAARSVVQETTSHIGASLASSQPAAGASPAVPGNIKLDVETPKAFSGRRDVIIGNFKVSFVTARKGTNKTRGTLMRTGGMGRASAKVELDGISPQVMQEITDAAYDDFKEQLAALGYNVQPRAMLEQNAAFRKVVSQNSPYKTAEPQPAVKADALVFAPDGQKLYFLPAQGAGTQGIGWSSPSGGYTKVAVETGVPVIDVIYVVDFANFGGYGGRSTASISVGQSISVLNGSNLFLTAGESGTFSVNQGSIRLSQPVGSPAQFASIEEEGQSAANQVGSVIAKGAAVLLGGGTRSLRSYRFRADPALYRQAVLETLSRTNQAIVARMASLR